VASWTTRRHYRDDPPDDVGVGVVECELKRPAVSDGVRQSVSPLVTTANCGKTADRWLGRDAVWGGRSSGSTRRYIGVQLTHTVRGKFLGVGSWGGATYSNYWRMGHQPCKNGWTDRVVVLGDEWGVAKESCIRLASTLAPSGQYVWAIVRGGYEWVWRQKWRRGLISNYFGQSCYCKFFFTCATLCLRGVCYGPVSVCLSVCYCVKTAKKIKLSFGIGAIFGSSYKAIEGYFAVYQKSTSPQTLDVKFCHDRRKCFKLSSIDDRCVYIAPGVHICLQHGGSSVADETLVTVISRKRCETDYAMMWMFATARYTGCDSYTANRIVPLSAAFPCRFT